MLYILTESRPEALLFIVCIEPLLIFFVYQKTYIFCNSKLATEFFKPLVKKSSELYNLEKDRKLMRGEKDQVTF